jgi:hypothetical protein
MASGKTAGAMSGAAAGAQAGTAIMPGWGTAIGAVVGGVAGYFGSKDKKPPQAAPFTPLDIRTEQKNAIDANLANFDRSATLASKTNSFTMSESQRLLEQALPGISTIQKRMLSEVNKDLDGQTTLPRDVQEQTARFAAEKGVSRGTSGNFNAFNLVKDFGFNLIDWQQASRVRALNTLSTVYGMAPRVNVMSPMASMVDPNTAIGVASQNNGMKYNIEQSRLNAQNQFENGEAATTNGALMGTMSSFGSIIGGMGGMGVQQKTGSVPSMQSGQAYRPLANAKPFAMPGQ